MLGTLKRDDLPGSGVGSHPSDCLEDHVCFLLIQCKLSQIVDVIDAITGMKDACPATSWHPFESDPDRNLTVGGEDVLEYLVNDALIHVIAA